MKLKKEKIKNIPWIENLKRLFKNIFFKNKMNIQKIKNEFLNLGLLDLKIKEYHIDQYLSRFEILKYNNFSHLDYYYYSMYSYDEILKSCNNLYTCIEGDKQMALCKIIYDVVFSSITHMKIDILHNSKLLITNFDSLRIFHTGFKFNRNLSEFNFPNLEIFFMGHHFNSNIPKSLPKLKTLTLGNDYNLLINFKNYPELENFTSGKNFNKKCDFRENKKLKKISFQDNMNSIIKLNNPNLEFISLGKYYKKNLNIDNCHKLKTLMLGKYYQHDVYISNINIKEIYLHENYKGKIHGLYNPDIYITNT